MIKGFTIVSAALIAVLFSQCAFAHCEIPCGIYGDRMRIAMIAEDIETIEKSMKEILKLSKAGDKNYNQLVRWVTNKDHHATRIQETVYQYFMAQRIKPPANDKHPPARYVTELTLLHEMIVVAMKCKQTTELAHTTNLRKLLEKFEKSYFVKKSNPSSN